MRVRSFFVISVFPNLFLLLLPYLSVIDVTNGTNVHVGLRPLVDGVGAGEVERLADILLVLEGEL